MGPPGSPPAGGRDPVRETPLPPSTALLEEEDGALRARLTRIASYSPAEVKSAIVGHGKAEKQQINYMVVRLLNLRKRPPSDAADAMAVALTHIHHNPWKTTR